MRRYVITAFEHNHIARGVPIDPRILSDEAVILYCVDAERPSIEGRPLLLEADIDLRLSRLGSEHLAEWSFFLAEHLYAFAEYPFFVISSRFYEKNSRLRHALPAYDACLGDALARYGFGYLPSYDRDTHFEDLAVYLREARLGMIPAGVDYAGRAFGVSIASDYRFMSDFFCNYIGFRDRAAFEEYFATMARVLDDFVSRDLTLRRSYEGIVKRRDVFRREKPFALFLEMCSHMHFFCNDIPFAGLKYDGLYEVHERRTTSELIRAL